MTIFAITREASSLTLEENGEIFILRINQDPGMADEFELDLRDLIFLRAELNAIISEVNHDEED